MASRVIKVQAILRKYGLRPKRSWSQNFLVDLDTLAEIAEAARCADLTVVELGAGFGALTAALAQTARKVVAVERDRDLAGLLRGEFAGVGNVEILEANAATLDWPQLAGQLGEKPVVVGNLPYHMSTPILFHLLENRLALSRWVLMFQREMAARLVASPGGRSYGVLSVLVQRLAEVETVLEIGPKAFFPPPKVISRVLRFVPLEAPRVSVRDERLFAQVVRGAFSQRRKKLRNSLAGSMGSLVEPGGVDRALRLSEIDPDSRAEQVSLEGFARLADAFAEIVGAGNLSAAP